MACYLSNSRCFRCNSSYKISEIAPGKFSCSGICKTKFLIQQEEEEKKLIRMGGGQEDIQWKTGDFCRTIYLEDGIEYEGVLESVDKTEDDKKYGSVKFLGYGNVQTCWLEELSPSRGPQARKEQEEAAAGDAGVASKAEWKVGDACRAVFTDDGVEYEADITTLDKDEHGRQYAELTFIGYNNCQTVWADDILQSKGDEARKQQMIDAGVETQVLPTGAGDAKSVVINYVIGDNCRIVYSGDGQQYEGKITSIENDEAGRKYTTVRLSGYGIEDTAWYDELMPSKGSDARKMQRKEAKDKEIKATPAEAAEKTPKPTETEVTQSKPIEPEPEKPQKEIESVVIKEKIIEEPVKQEVVIKQKPEKIVVENTTPVKEDVSTSVKKPDTPIPHNFKKGDHVRTIYSADGLEYEGKLQSIDKDDEGKEYVTVMFWGYLNEETVWIDELMPSRGAESIAAQEKAAASSVADVTNGENSVATTTPIATATTEVTPAAVAATEPAKAATSTVEPNPNETDDSSVTITSSVNDEIRIKLYFAEKLEKCNQEIESLQNKVATLTKQNEDLLKTKSVDKNSNSFNSQNVLEEKVKALQSKNSELEMKHSESLSKIKALEVKEQENSQKFSKLKEDSLFFDKKNGELKTQLRNAEDMVKELSIKIKNLELKNKELLEKNTDKNGNINSVTAEQFRVHSQKYNEMEILLSKSTADSKALISKVINNTHFHVFPISII